MKLKRSIESNNRLLPHRLEPVFVVIVFEPRSVVGFLVLQRFHPRLPLLLELSHHQPFKWRNKKTNKKKQQQQQRNVFY